MVSIILCTYNRAQFLPNAIRSVLAQSYPNWELIVVDDGSSDTTYSVVRRFRIEDERIRYFSQANKGLAKARNVGLRLAEGQYLCFIDSDDDFDPTHIERRVYYLKSHASIDFLHGGARLIGPRSKKYVVDMIDPTKRIHLSKCHIGGTFFFRRSVLAKAKGFRAVPFEDFDFYQRVERSCSVRRVHYPTYNYHLDSDSRLCDLFAEARAASRRKPDDAGAVPGDSLASLERHAAPPEARSSRLYRRHGAALARDTLQSNRRRRAASPKG